MASIGIMGVMAIASTAFSFVGSMQQAAQQEAQAEQQQAIYEMQAEQTRLVAERNALILRDEGERNAESLKIEGKAKQADAQRRFIEMEKDKRLAASRLTNIAAASGGGAGDPTVLNIAGDIEEAGSFASGNALFYGDSAANLLFNQADLTLHSSEQQALSVEHQGATNADFLNFQGQNARYIGETRAAATRTAAVGNLISNAGSLYGKYAPTTYNSNTGSAGARASYFPESGQTVTWGSY